MPAYNTNQLAMIEHFDMLREHTIGAIKRLQDQKRRSSLEVFLAEETIHFYKEKKHRKLVNEVLLDTLMDHEEEPNIWKCFEQVEDASEISTSSGNIEKEKKKNKKSYRKIKKLVPIQESSSEETSSSEESKDSGVDLDSEPEVTTFKLINKLSARQPPRKFKVFTPEEIQKQQSIVDEFKRKIQKYDN